MSSIIEIAAHLFAATFLFFTVNWIGRHAVDFGYSSMTLFEDSNESVALNFFLRAMSPAVFTIILSAIATALKHPEFRIGVFKIAIYYYVIRFIIIFLLNRQRLVSWPKFFGHAFIGIALSGIAYRYLIIPGYSLLPNIETAGNELWLAILAFLYAVANKVPMPGGPGARRRNRFVAYHYELMRRKYGSIIDNKIRSKHLKVLVYSVLIYEDYARPPAIRKIERTMFWKSKRTTGIMQVSSINSLSDEESVFEGLKRLYESWRKHSSEQNLHARAHFTIAEYNADNDYISRVWSVAEILAIRVEPRFRQAYDEFFE